MLKHAQTHIPPVAVLSIRGASRHCTPWLSFCKVPIKFVMPCWALLPPCLAVLRICAHTCILNQNQSDGEFCTTLVRNACMLCVYCKSRRHPRRKKSLLCVGRLTMRHESKSWGAARHFTRVVTGCCRPYTERNAWQSSMRSPLARRLRKCISSKLGLTHVSRITFF